MQGEVKKGGNYVLLPPFLKEGWGGGFKSPRGILKRGGC